MVSANSKYNKADISVQEMLTGIAKRCTDDAVAM